MYERPLTPAAGAEPQFNGGDGHEPATGELVSVGARSRGSHLQATRPAQRKVGRQAEHPVLSLVLLPVANGCCSKALPFTRESVIFWRQLLASASSSSHVPFDASPAHQSLPLASLQRRPSPSPLPTPTQCSSTAPRITSFHACTTTTTPPTARLRQPFSRVGCTFRAGRGGLCCRERAR